MLHNYLVNESLTRFHRGINSALGDRNMAQISYIVRRLTKRGGELVDTKEPYSDLVLGIDRVIQNPPARAEDQL